MNSLKLAQASFVKLPRSHFAIPHSFANSLKESISALEKRRPLALTTRSAQRVRKG